MAPQPSQPKIYHITHVQNLVSIVQGGALLSDAERLNLGLDCQIVGMPEIKRRRLEELELSCHPGTMVGEYVPFYFCSRSIMLYILHMGNHPDLIYREGQRPIVHLQADLEATIRWADANRVPWAFSDSNAGGRLAQFYNRAADLDKVDWDSVAARDFRGMTVKEGKQAEFLLWSSFPWRLIEHIGVIDDVRLHAVRDIVDNAGHRPPISIEPTWYF